MSTVFDGFRTVWDALELVQFLVLLVRGVTAPFRLLARALDALFLRRSGLSRSGATEPVFTNDSLWAAR